MKKLLFILLILVMVNNVIGVDYTCGDSICQANENHFSCPDDCEAGIIDNYCNNIEDEICDADCYKTDPDCKDYAPEVNEKKGESNTLKVIAVVIFVIVVGGVVFYLYEHANKQQNIYDVKKIVKKKR